jgi:hypothetical protein
MGVVKFNIKMNLGSESHPEEAPKDQKREGQTGLGASKRDHNVKQEEAQGIISFKVVRNDK